jgi:2-polyprenyl-6-methoxyphenol hydroxylase-like FAD-dependent oxidoreductase
MNTGMQDSYNLGWKLALVATGAAPETLLNSYEADDGRYAGDRLLGR